VTDEAEVDTLPPLGEGDVYVYAFRNGGIGVIYGDGRRLDVTLADAQATARGAYAAGCQVWIGGDDAPRSLDALHRITAVEVPFEPFGAPQPPQTWPGGTDALMSAAAHGQDPVLDDLLERGADVHQRDRAGSSALHHAAAEGNVHAIDALVAHGAELDRPNDRGATPLRLAEGRGHDAAAARLRSLGAASVGPSAAPSAVGRMHGLVLRVWLVPPVLLALTVGLTWPPSLATVVVVAVLLGLLLLVAPREAIGAGIAPRTFEGSKLVGRRGVGRVRLDLDQVTYAAFGGSTSTGNLRAGRWILLAHPDGARLSRSALRRLLVPRADRDEVLARGERFVVVPVDGPTRAEVMVPIARALDARRVPRTATLAAQLTEAAP
jgi:hypothetical protein